jgi:S-adenosylmethionine/arginine decarboxylase-like enzyme
MDNYIGKHLLIDCYNCDSDNMESPRKGAVL